MNVAELTVAGDRGLRDPSAEYSARLFARPLSFHP